MLITSERKYTECKKCKGSGKIEEVSIMPWYPDTTRRCIDCGGSGKIEADKYDFDKNVFNITNIVTIGGIETEFGECDFGFKNYCEMWFYINGHIKIQKTTEEWKRHEDSDKITIMQKKTFNELKKIRDELIKKLKEV